MAEGRHIFWSDGASDMIRETGAVSFRETVEVDAAGYRNLRKPLAEYTGRSWDLHGSPLPVVKIALKKANR